MAESIWTKDLNGGRSKQVNNLIQGGFGVGGIYLVMGVFAFCLAPFSLWSVVFNSGIVIVALLGLLTGWMILKRHRMALGFAWSFVILLALVSVVALLITILKPAGSSFSSFIINVAWIGLSVILIRSLVSQEIHDYLEPMDMDGYLQNRP